MTITNLIDKLAHEEAEEFIENMRCIPRGELMKEVDNLSDHAAKLVLIKIIRRSLD